MHEDLVSMLGDRRHERIRLQLFASLLTRVDNRDQKIEWW
jgi:hypothetical protein